MREARGSSVSLELVTRTTEQVPVRTAPLPDGRAPRRRSWLGRGLAVDVAALAASGGAAIFLVPLLDVGHLSLLWAAALVAVALFLLAARGLYAARLHRALLEDLRLVVATSGASVMAVITARVALTDASYVAAQEVVHWFLLLALVTAGKSALHAFESRRRRRGKAFRPTLIVGAGAVGHLVAQRLIETPELGLRPIGFLDKEPLPDLNGLPVLGASWDLERVIREHGVEQVIITFSTAPHTVMLRIARTCEELGVGYAVVPRLFESFAARLTVDYLGGLPLISVRRLDPKGWQFAVKYALDRVVAAALLLLLAPVLLVVAGAILASMGRPILFAQERVGRDGRRFRMLKFRSMHPAPMGEERESDAERLTRLGRFLRRTSLDELPQLVNVLRGEMSLVGPRPERPELVASFSERVYRYDERHRVKSGITGWAQVHGIGRGRHRFSPVSLANRAEWDNYYIENWSPWLDIKILILTIRALLRFRQD
jgi:exopolysaccharide biosynthesis polyprenyl glycosylphosphotransferase